MRALSQVYTGWLGGSSPSILGGTGAVYSVSILVACFISTVLGGFALGIGRLFANDACHTRMHSGLTAKLVPHLDHHAEKDAKHHTACRQGCLDASAILDSTGQIAPCIGLTMLLTTVATWLHKTAKDNIVVAREQIGEAG